MQRLGLEVEVIECRWGDGADEKKLEEILKADTGKKIKAVAVVHNETTTGVTSDIAEVGLPFLTTSLFMLWHVSMQYVNAAEEGKVNGAHAEYNCWHEAELCCDSTFIVIFCLAIAHVADLSLICGALIWQCKMA